MKDFYMKQRNHAQGADQGLGKPSEMKKLHHFNTLSLPFNDRQREGYHLQFNKARLLEQLSFMSLKNSV